MPERVKRRNPTRTTKPPAAVVEALLRAVGVGNTTAVRALLRQDSQLVNAVGPHPFWGGHCQPLHVALDTNRPAMVTLLLEAGADVDGANDGYAHWSPLMIAVVKRRTRAIRQLRARGARIGLAEALLLGDDRRVRVLLARGRRALRGPVPGNASWLVFARTPRAIDHLLALRVSAEQKDQFGITPVEAFSRLGPLGKRLVQQLAAQGVAVPAHIYGRLNDRSALRRLERLTPGALRDPRVLVAAVDGQHHRLVAWLLAAGADVNARAAEGSQGTVLHSAAWAGDVAMVRLLLAHGAATHARDPEHDATPLGWAKTARQVTNNPRCDDVAALLTAVQDPTPASASPE